ncbi:MAG: 50S ribosomal protein L15 [Candidatus Omnitrophica bacterium CG12_big_fil_rev_8_21_14_0_65_50_5]|nr:MAG: 50S ribosomal protein L15 [Candidatus Omnitrophica bacterium CG12_big_fil_rev_8_21_14_0_65_50_5]
MHLHELKSPTGSHKRRKIVGRGPGSGHGKTSCRGQKGQNSRGTGRTTLRGFEGGQMRIVLRTPKIGFHSRRPIDYQRVNIADLSALSGDTIVDKALLKKQGLIHSINKPCKILGHGELKIALILRVRNVSASAKDKILKAGGKIEEDRFDRTEWKKQTER